VAESFFYCEEDLAEVIAVRKTAVVCFVFVRDACNEEVGVDHVVGKYRYDVSCICEVENVAVKYDRDSLDVGHRAPGGIVCGARDIGSQTPAFQIHSSFQVSSKKALVQFVEDAIWYIFRQAFAFQIGSLDTYVAECGGGISLLVEVVDNKGDGLVNVPA
jgi:hypothetical protein